MVGVERVLEGGADDGLILPRRKSFLECSNSACVRRRGHNDDLRRAQSLHFPGDFIHLLLGISQSDRERDEPTTPGLRGRSELRGCIPVPRQTGCRISASRRQIFRSAHPYFGCLPHLEESRGFRGAIRQLPLRTTITSAEESISSRTSHRPALPAAITTARVRSRQTDK